MSETKTQTEGSPVLQGTVRSTFERRQGARSAPGVTTAHNKPHVHD